MRIDHIHLKSLVAVNLVASAAHFLHNAVFLDEYPGPPWIPGPGFVIVVWCVIATILVLGYTWHQQGKSGRALVAIVVYCCACFAVFGHYLYGTPSDFDLLTNALIAGEGVSAIVLLAYYLRNSRLA